MEPHNLTQWRTEAEDSEIYTCGRPGRAQGSNRQKISDELVSEWVHGLPEAEKITIVSLLGRKGAASGLSEFSYYSFCGGFDTDAERAGQPGFQEWLQQHHPERAIRVLEFPTFDGALVPEQVLALIADAIRECVAADEMVVIMDSAGCSRTGRVCQYMNLVQVDCIV